MTSNDLRKISMLDWLKNDLRLPVERCEPASSDASFRRYFRITLPDQQLVVMDAPPDRENIKQFIKVAELFKLSDVQIPVIYHQNLDDGFLVLEDFGSQSFLDKVNADNANGLYGNALASLLKLQVNTGHDKAALPRYDEALLQRELGIFEDWFIEQALGLKMPTTIWDNVRCILVESALEQPVTCVHRDYHCRNLMVLGDNSMGIIDFQDAVIGPVTYDLVSLLRDCYIAWPQNQVALWASQYYQMLKQAGVIACELPQFTRWFDLMGMQRHLKAIGIFSRLNLRDGKSGYLKDIPRTLNYVMAQAQAYPELDGFHNFLQQHVLPNFPEAL
ncbi:aminoglycoside phosphotransferase [Methyloglobulus morosus KoM1]|uniref:Aminoglycoside phosphotransferase n=1 Tax=Methyloglobulus morosus KoM1 TaxID=1116472 RepID=V5BIK9_9GAMM|nr:phosphotransferase [Methyloglobulus morosus]ESS73130.1 aminoglycoside phosphotransferase [Methyloglobulus morosus KoM1]